MVSLLDSLIVLFITSYAFIAPFTKVEESFNIQAVHDIMSHGTDLAHYDHKQFPGAVPRTFVGAVVLSLLSKPAEYLMREDESGIGLQLMVRGLLGVMNALALIYLKDAAVSQIKAVQKKHNHKHHRTLLSSVGFWFVLFQVSQFHIIYYSSRTLPNSLALPLTNISLGQVIHGNYASGITLLAFATIVFRIEISALMLSIGLVALIFRKVTLFSLIKSALVGSIVGAVLSGVVDSLFWGRLIIPELESFIFNVIEGKSSEWGTEPLHAYFSKYLFSIFIPPTVVLLNLIGTICDNTKGTPLKILGIASILYIIIISFQPHKEWRFIIYIIPIFTLNAASGATRIYSNFRKESVYKFLTFGMILSSIISLAFSLLWLNASAANYPGGEALMRLNDLILKRVKYEHITDTNITVHMSVPACMTGVTLFGELRSDITGINVTYDKTENEETLQEIWGNFDYLISEIDLSDKIQSTKIQTVPGYEWIKLASVNGFAGINVELIKSFKDPELWKPLLYFVVKHQSIQPVVSVLDSLVMKRNLLFIYWKAPNNTTDSRLYEEYV